MAQMLTAKQVAEVKGCSPRYIKKIIQDGKLKAVETVNSKNRKTYLGTAWMRWMRSCSTSIIN